MVWQIRTDKVFHLSCYFLALLEFLNSNSPPAYFQTWSMKYGVTSLQLLMRFSINPVLLLLCPPSVSVTVPFLIDFWWEGEEANSWTATEKRSITEKRRVTRIWRLKIGAVFWEQIRHVREKKKRSGMSEEEEDETQCGWFLLVLF